MLLGLVRRFGPAAVARAGWEEFRFPPAWVTHGSEVARLRVRLEREA